MPKPPTFYQFFPWILNRMEKRQASKEKLSEIMWRIFGKNRSGGKLTSSGVPRTIRRLLNVVPNRGEYTILLLTKDDYYTIGPDGEKVLQGSPPKGLKGITESEINRWKKVCLDSTGRDIDELIEKNIF